MQRFVPGLVLTLLAASAQCDVHDYRVLLLGNSHSSSNSLPTLVEKLLENDGFGVEATVKASRRWNFLAARLDDGISQKVLESKQWTHVILQAQKYSTSGRYTYPTDAAQEWIRRVRAQNAVPILFPEWARYGNMEEGPRIHQLHLGIASREPACVAPVGIAWQLVQESNPEIRLHHADGNHSNRNGAHLTAYVLYQAISGNSANNLPYLEKLNIKPALQKLFRKSAAESFQVSPISSFQSCG